MPPKYMLAAILGIAALTGGSYCYKQWLSHRLEMRRLEATRR